MYTAADHRIGTRRSPARWEPSTWRSKDVLQQPLWPDADALDWAARRVSELPPLVHPLQGQTRESALERHLRVTVPSRKKTSPSRSGVTVPSSARCRRTSTPRASRVNQATRSRGGVIPGASGCSRSAQTPPKGSTAVAVLYFRPSSRRCVTEADTFLEVHRRLDSWPAGLHLELTGDDVSECSVDEGPEVPTARCATPGSMRNRSRRSCASSTRPFHRPRYVSGRGD